MKARFHLPDFSKHYGFNIIFAEMLKYLPEYFREGVEIASVYGIFPPSIWNGGRFSTACATRTSSKPSSKPSMTAVFP